MAPTAVATLEIEIEIRTAVAPTAVATIEIGIDAATINAAIIETEAAAIKAATAPTVEDMALVQNEASIPTSVNLHHLHAPPTPLRPLPGTDIASSTSALVDLYLKGITMGLTKMNLYQHQVFHHSSYYYNSHHHHSW